MTALLVAVGAALGGALRHALTVALDDEWPWGTLAANLGGSALLGASAALALGGRTWAFVAVGFCGALTTFSSFAVQTVDRRLAPATTYVAATVLGCVGLCAGCWWLVGMLS